MASEIADIGAYRNFLAQTMPASATFVAFHNLVTASVSEPEHFQGGVRHFYCASQVVQTMPSLFTAGAVYTYSAPANVVGVPGVSTSHSLVSCPS